MREKDLFFGEVSRNAGVESQVYTNTWLSASVEIGPFDHDTRGYPWKVVVAHNDDGARKVLEGSGSTRNNAKAQAVFAMTKHINDAVDADAAYQQRKAIYNFLSQRDGVPLATPETAETARARMKLVGAPHIAGVGEFGMLSFAVAVKKP